MWKPISQSARGFLSLLGLQNTGRNPGVLLDDVRPTVDLRPFWLQGTAQQVVNGVSTVNPRVGTFMTIFTVPAGQLWYVHSFCAQFEANFGPAVLVDIRAGVLEAAFPSPESVMRGRPSADLLENPVVNLTAPVYMMESLRDFWAPPGTRLRVNATYCDIQNAGGTEILAVGWVRYTPMQV